MATRQRHFSAWQLSLAYCMASLSVLVLFAAPLWYRWQTTINGGRTEQMQSASQRLAHAYQKRGAKELGETLADLVGDDRQLLGSVLLLANSHHFKIAGNLPDWPDGQPCLENAVSSARVAVGGRQIPIVYLCTRLSDGNYLLVGNNVQRFESLSSLLLWGLVGCALVFLVISLAAGLWLRSALLAQAGWIDENASAIIQQGLTRRLPESPARLGEHDEFDALTRTVNRMLDQIERLLQETRHVADAIAHDLRTPLAELRYRLEEVMITKPPLEDTFHEVEASIAKVDEVLAIFNALLRLAEIDSGARRAGFARLNLADMVAEVLEFYQPLAEEKGIALQPFLAREVPVQGDPRLLAQAVGNLVDNALKYAGAGGQVSVNVGPLPHGAAEVTVADNGPGIPIEERGLVLQRFYRRDASRASPGVGLGLSLVDAVARLHGGTLTLGDNAPGLRATLLIRG